MNHAIKNYKKLQVEGIQKKTIKCSKNTKNGRRYENF